MNTSKIMLWVTKNTAVWLISLVMFIPFILVLLNSFKSVGESTSMSMSWPTSWHFGNYVEVFKKGKLLTSFYNSLYYAIISNAVGVIFSAMAAYVLSRNRTKWNHFLFFFIVLGIALPINQIPLTKMMQMTHLIDTRTGMALLFASLQIPFSVFLIYGFIGTIPKQLDESGSIDGCGRWSLFIKIILPLLLPALTTVIVLNFLNTWNDFMLPLYFLHTTELWPMTLAIYSFFGRYSVQWNLVCADIMLTSLPVILVYLVGQRYIVAGMTAGAVKG
ncbi:ABC transporter permease [Paenibacillus pectinilyticus]|uniref:ABC transporter permease n=1 Tax=Paenibacillus pectinilyticus TaxID=512399 RepID=A0A1C1A4K7_9BACL|nr:carbohydrate ABC transporter permease [Paenibacillus pectinilyticus]OCT15484.1 ABC transporter permease [Paenibacillus pectinilyticus]